MAAGTAIKVVTKIPWKQIISLSPEISKAAKAIWKHWESKPKPQPIDQTESINSQITAISNRIQQLEGNEAAQSKVVAEIAEQLQLLATGLKVTATRQTLNTWSSVAALALAVAALVAAIVK